ncbi:MAG: PKD domain-containing protein [Spirochaetales bacterium]|nr:PKD domain-containing protein [Spirochaetales bacterium]
MKQHVYVFIPVMFFTLIIFTGCTYIIPDNTGTREYTTPSPLIENKADGENHLIYNDNRGPTPVEHSAVPEPSFQHEKTPSRENNNPVADFHIVPDVELCVGMNIFFDAGASSDPDGDYLEYYWDFGNGSHLFGPTQYNPVCHRYLIKGEYTIRLTVLDSNGKSSVKEELIRIREF